MTRTLILYFVLSPLSLLLLGCERNVIRGMVVDVKGDLLPGVAVSVAGTEFQGLTDALGRYTVAYEPGALVLDFMKTGYTPGRLELEVNETRPVEASQVMLWPLPPNKGVYLFDDYQYRETYPTEPKAHVSHDGVERVYAVKRLGVVETTKREPTIICYRMRPYDVRMCRLEFSKVTVRAEKQVRQVPLWIPVWTWPLSVGAIDEPERLLLHLNLPRPLEPGVYAVHWGALEGQTTLDSRVFIFSVVEEEKMTVSG